MTLVLNGTNGLSDVDGSAATPAIRGTDANTGIFFPAADTVAASTGGTERMRIDSSGNVGIGTASPSVKLQTNVTRTSGTNVTAFVLSDSVTGAQTTGYGTQIQGWSNAGAAVSAIGFEAYGGTNNDTAIAFYTQVSAANLQRRVTIDSSGNLLVGTTSSDPTVVGARINASATIPQISVAVTTTSNNYLLYNTTAAAYRFFVSSAGVVNATTTTITAISDQRWKENIRDLDDGLEKVLALKPRKFDWKEGKGEDTKNARGFIAQELETVFPDMVTEWIDPAPDGEESYKAVNANLIPTLVKAIQEQQAVITTLTDRVSALDDRITALEAKP